MLSPMYALSMVQYMSSPLSPGEFCCKDSPISEC
jgi:hypothetical protein